ncbi:Sporulation protein-like protein [Candidatus Koribacter versatilis Ellin345]|uniref:Sporulation protein-like protein n=1 Tax=Koribacter versatilis (strain Ellin345) TaxID=204669 RepID=Q1IT67_KORVE|nr:DUF2300 domain-containing protein [Candidatus Koribacter versatilis]ABF39933.1 Sporulation protein-like protein [Candidatus Koribacter versatilis Ellin345]
MKVLRWLCLFFATTAMAQQPPFRVRLLSLYHLQEVTIAPDGPSTLRLDGKQEKLMSTIAVRVDGGSIRIGDRAAMRVAINGPVRISGGTIRPMSVHVPLEISAVRGELRVIAVYPTEEYVAAVLQGETAGDMPPEALKALAVAIRSYATRFRERHKEEHFDFCDSTHCQYLRTDVSPAVQQAVTQTANELLWDRGSPLAAYYHKDCGGRTEDVASVWPDQRSAALVAHEDPYCKRVSKDWSAELTREEIAKALEAAKLQVPVKWDRIVVTSHTASGRVQRLEFRVGESQQRATMSASSFRFALGHALGWNTLKSDWYEVSGNGDRFVFRGRGVGHGVGLCQTGAAEMARSGKNYREILAFYYPGTANAASAQGIPWISRAGKVDVRAVNIPDAERVLPASEEALAWASQKSGLVLSGRAAVDVYPTVEMFRNATGEPGWVAASTRGDHVRIQPPSVLGSRLRSLLRHEFLHLLVESNAKPGTPLWFREGLVLYLGDESRSSVVHPMTTDEMSHAIETRSDEASVRRAYEAATTRVAAFAKQYGVRELLRWLRSGIPNDVAVSSDKVAQ